HCALVSGHRESRRTGLRLDEKRPVVLFVARLSAVKAPQDLLDAFLDLRQNWNAGAPPYLLFVGDGPLRPELEARAKKLANGDVRFLGFCNQSELPALYDLCDVFVLPSHFEPWGLVVNEAMNAGKPVIVSDQVGAAPDLVKSGQNGFIFRAGDTKDLTAK